MDDASYRLDAFDKDWTVDIKQVIFFLLFSRLISTRIHKVYTYVFFETITNATEYN